MGLRRLDLLRWQGRRASSTRISSSFSFYLEVCLVLERVAVVWQCFRSRRRGMCWIFCEIFPTRLTLELIQFLRCASSSYFIYLYFLPSDTIDDLIRWFKRLNLFGNKFDLIRSDCYSNENKSFNNLYSIFHKIHHEARLYSIEPLMV